MVTTYQIFCSCGCGEIIERKVFKSGACKVRAYRDTVKQTIILDSGDVTKSNINMKPLVTKPEEMKPKVTSLEWNPKIPEDWQPASNLSKEHFARKSKTKKK